MVEWKAKRVEECASFYNGTAHENIVSDTGNFILITSKSIATELADYRLVSEQLFPLYVDDIVMVMSDIPNGRALAKCLLIDKNNKYTLNQRICCFREHKTDTRFLFYQLNRNKCFLAFNDGYNQTNLRKIDILKCEILIPPLHEQHRIAKALSDTDDFIAALEKLIAKKRAIKQGAMQELLTGKRRLSGFNGEWIDTVLGQISDILKGKGLSKSKVSVNGRYFCVLYGELFTEYTEIIHSIVSKTEYEEGILSKKGDILIPGSTTTTGIDLARASTIPFDEVLIGGDVNIIRPRNNDVDSIFLSFYITNTKKQEIAIRAKGITVYHLHGKDLMDLPLRIPNDKAEQTAIASIISDMDAELDALTTKLNKLRNIKQGMMSELLTGRIRLEEQETR